MSKKWRCPAYWWMGTSQNGIRVMVSTLCLDGPGNWNLKRRFRKEIVVEMEKNEVQCPVFDIEPELGHISGYGIKISEQIVVEKDKI